MPPLAVELPFGINLDFTFWSDLSNLSALQLYGALFSIIGWVIIALLFFYIGKELWLECRIGKYTAKWKWVLLAVDVPPLFIQTPKAVEQIFAQLSGARINPSFVEKYWHGKKQKWFSIEIISIEGYIQFLVRTEFEFRDLVEAAVYAQYPEAEITEVEDYVDILPNHYPGGDYDVLGIEFKLAEHSSYPIRTYPSFEYNISKDLVFSDPMAALLENFSRIAHGENLWFQIIIEPTSNSWKEEGIKLVKKIVSNKKEEHHQPLVVKIIGLPFMLFQEVVKSLFSSGEEESKHKKEEKPSEGKVSDLTPGTKSIVEAIEEKIAKIGFKSKLRLLYAARKEAFNPTRCVHGFIGAMNQFHIMSRNAIVPQSATAVGFPFAAWRTSHHTTSFIQGYKKRKLKVGGNPYILNIEELATVWHFPLPFVKTPLVSKAGAKRAEPPLGLPVEVYESPLKKKGQAEEEHISIDTDAPEELPYG